MKYTITGTVLGQIIKYYASIFIPYPTVQEARGAHIQVVRLEEELGRVVVDIIEVSREIVAERDVLGRLGAAVYTGGLVYPDLYLLGLSQ